MPKYEQLVVKICSVTEIFKSGYAKAKISTFFFKIVIF